MSTFVHPTQFRHYLKLYPIGDTETAEVDVEEHFKCRFVSLKNAQNPSVKSVYVEDYADHDGQRVFSSANVVYNASELTLTLRWVQKECEDVQEWSEKFIQYITGRKFQYRDTLRPGKYWQFIFKNEPNIENECLYGSNQYRFVSFKLNNFGGKPKSSSQL